MRHVATTEEVADLWARQAAERARAGNGSLAFHGRVIWSYDTPIGHLIHAPDGALVALVSTAQRGKASSAHRRAVCDALLTVGLPAYLVPHVGVEGGGAPTPAGGSASYHRANVAWLRETAPNRVAAYQERFCRGGI